MGFFRSVKECEQISADYGSFFRGRAKDLWNIFSDKEARGRLGMDLKFVFVLLCAGAVFGLTCFLMITYLEKLGALGNLAVLCVLFALYKCLCHKQELKKQKEQG